jgi:hypothetical protein
MEFKYLFPSILKKYLLQSLDESDGSFYFIGSIGDVLLETEFYKESLTLKEFNKLFNNIEAIPQKAYYIQDLSKDELISNMFDNSLEEVNLDFEVERYDLPTHYTINYLVLKPNENSCFWDINVLEEMQSIYI